MTAVFLGSLSKVWQQSYRLAFPVVLVAIIFSCDSSTSSENQSISTDPQPVQRQKKKIPQEGMVQYTRKDNTLLSEINYLNYRKHGLATGYYRNGNKHTQVTYEQGLKHGPAMIYYENGKPYRETIYHYGVNHGTRKLYRQNGDLFAEIPFQKGHAGMGLKEYNLEGKLKTIYPELIVEGFDSIKVNSQYTVKAYFKDGSRKAKLYMGELAQGKYLHDDLKPLDADRGTATMVYHINPGTSVSTTINIIGVHTTRLRSPRVVQRSFAITAENQ